MDERANILSRIRQALSHGGAAHAGPAPDTPVADARQWLPLVGRTPQERLDQFRRNAADLKADFHLVDDRESMLQLILNLRDQEGWKKAGSHAGYLTDMICARLALPICATDQGYQAADLESCSVGITECDALIAQTGSVLVTSRSAGGRALSVLPPHHVVLARRSQLVGDLTDAFELLKRKYASNYPSLISFITGPSRTGDIERILVLGAHGPRRLTIACWAD